MIRLISIHATRERVVLNVVGRFGTARDIPVFRAGRTPREWATATLDLLEAKISESDRWRIESTILSIDSTSEVAA